MERILEQTVLNYCYTRIGGRKYKVKIPMTSETLDAIRIAQAGGKSEKTSQMTPIYSQYPGTWKKYFMKIRPLEN